MITNILNTIINKIVTNYKLNGVMIIWLLK